MDAAQVKEEIIRIVYPDIPNEWELDEHAGLLASLPEEIREEVFKLIGVIWPVSHSLCLIFLANLQRGLGCLQVSQLAEWVRAVLDVYESGGLAEANRFMVAVHKEFFCRLRGETGIRFADVEQRLAPYLQGLAGRHVELAAGPVGTDTETVFIPPEVGIFAENANNFLIYKLAVSFQWAFIALGTYRAEFSENDPVFQEVRLRYGGKIHQSNTWLGSFFQLFSDPLLAEDLFHAAECVRVTEFLQMRLPGLIRDTAPLRLELVQCHLKEGDIAMKEKFVRHFQGMAASLDIPAENSPSVANEAEASWRKFFSRCRGMGAAVDSLRMLLQLYRYAETLPGAYQRIPPLLFQGRLKPGAASAALSRRREEVRQRFIKAFSAIIVQEQMQEQNEKQRPAMPPATIQDGVALLMPREGTGRDAKENVPLPVHDPISHVTIGGRTFQLPESIQQLLHEMRDDLGRIPGPYIAGAFGLAGKGSSSGSTEEAEHKETLPPIGAVMYDEWDYRRSGFRRNWCRLIEKELHPVRGSFVENTLAKYRGQIKQLRRQFEMMRMEQRFVKRQQEGEDIDFDAAVEAFVDHKAGLAPSDRLFIRLARNERSVEAAFLLDMSSSTEGWINTALKESLVLMCEALSALGDSYSIYGFSGMRRLRSELFQVKHRDEPYGEHAKGRIAAITPQEYTRMGPPIRHVSRILAASEAKTRLLITLSDGKPEDYDEYKGDYAIEDTRHALIEAKAMGVHPFCITIDRSAHDYIAHMYGEVNYIFIDDVSKLPYRVPEIYRSLTV